MNYNNPGSGNNPKIPMADADFNSLYQSVQLQVFSWLKNELSYYCIQ
jgi:hypothetical protein